MSQHIEVLHSCHSLDDCLELVLDLDALPVLVLAKLTMRFQNCVYLSHSSHVMRADEARAGLGTASGFWGFRSCGLGALTCDSKNKGRCLVSARPI
jgi:hypothetical protein